MSSLIPANEQVTEYTHIHSHLSKHMCQLQIVQRSGTLIRLRQHPLGVAPEFDSFSNVTIKCFTWNEK